MKVLVIGHAYAVRLARGKWEALRKIHGVESLVVFPDRWPGPLGTVGAEVDDLSRTRALPVLWGGIEGRHLYRTGLWTAIEEFNPDIIHVEQGSDAVVLLQSLLFASFQRRRPRFGFFTWVNWPMKRSWKVRLVEAMNLKRVAYAVCGNRDAAMLLRQRGFSGPVVVSPQLSVDASICHPVDRETAKRDVGWDPGIPVIGFVGRIVAEKGVDDLVQAWIRLRRAGSHARLAFVGGGDRLPAVQQAAAENGLGDDLLVVPPVDHYRVVPFIQAMDALVLPSRTSDQWKEQFGYVLAEAMACGTPVIGSNSGAIPEVIGPAGLICPERDPAALGESIGRLLGSLEQRQRFAALGIERAKTHFSSEALAKSLYDLWTRVI